jgi:hypothetical protein
MMRMMKIGWSTVAHWGLFVRGARGARCVAERAREKGFTRSIFDSLPTCFTQVSLISNTSSIPSSLATGLEQDQISDPGVKSDVGSRQSSAR